jgi:hypothetical protein
MRLARGFSRNGSADLNARVILGRGIKLFWAWLLRKFLDSFLIPLAGHYTHENGADLIAFLPLAKRLGEGPPSESWIYEYEKEGIRI